MKIAKNYKLTTVHNKVAFRGKESVYKQVGSEISVYVIFSHLTKHCKFFNLKSNKKLNLKTFSFLQKLTYSYLNF